MNAEEYKSIRDEMLQRFRWSLQLAFFAVVSTAALLAWLSTEASAAKSNPLLSPWLFACVGLVVTGYLFYSYRELLRQIYNQGSYLTVFYEKEQERLRWHCLSRFGNQWLGEKSDWGRDGRRGGFLMLFLLSANIGGPLWLLRENLDFCGWNFLIFIIMIFLAIVVVVIAWGLFTTRRFMLKNVGHWLKMKKELEKDPNSLWNFIEGRYLDKESSAEQK